MLEIGSKAPNFKLYGDDGKEYTLDNITDKNLILYFYPKDNTPGCTVEAEEFSDLLDQFISKNTIVVGVSPDSVESHIKFKKDKGLKILLLSDHTRKVSEDYGAYGPKVSYGKTYMGIIRSTFLINNGIIKEKWINVKAKGHAQKVLEAINVG